MCCCVVTMLRCRTSPSASSPCLIFWAAWACQLTSSEASLSRAPSHSTSHSAKCRWVCWGAGSLAGWLTYAAAWGRPAEAGFVFCRGWCLLASHSCQAALVLSQSQITNPLCPCLLPSAPPTRLLLQQRVQWLRDVGLSDAQLRLVLWKHFRIGEPAGSLCTTASGVGLYTRPSTCFSFRGSRCTTASGVARVLTLLLRAGLPPGATGKEQYLGVTAAHTLPQPGCDRWHLHVPR
jgi:hypothetical protein